MDKEIAIDGKRELEDLVDAAAEGEAISLTRNGQVVGNFERSRRKQDDSSSSEAALERLRTFRKGQVLSSHPTIKELLDESRGR